MIEDHNDRRPVVVAASGEQVSRFYGSSPETFWTKLELNDKPKELCNCQ